MNRATKLFFLILMFAFTYAHGQKGLHAGFRAGISSAWILPQNNARTLEDYPDIAKSELAYKLKFGYNFGGVLGYNFNNNYGFQTEFLYEKTGQDYEDNFTPQAGPLNAIRNIDLSYLSIPVLFKYTSKNKENIKAYGLIGPQFGYLLRAKETVILNSVEKIDNIKAFDKFRHFDGGLGIGGGVDMFFMQNFYLNIGIYTYFGLSDINSDEIRNFISKNDNQYQGSKNFRGNLNIGFHYLFSKRHTNPWRTASFPLEKTNKAKNLQTN
jgi:opacity protein-like surface antigen